MSYKFICLECDHLFDEPHQFYEHHSHDPRDTEAFVGCPVCGGAFDEAVECRECHDVLPRCSTTDGLCDECYTRLTEEAEEDLDEPAPSEEDPPLSAAAIDFDYLRRLKGEYD